MPCEFAAGLIGSGRFRFWQPRCIKVCPRCIFTRGRDIVRRRDGGATVVVVVTMTMMTDNGSDKAAAGAADTAGNRKQSGMGAENARIRFRTSRYDRYHRYIQPPPSMLQIFGFRKPPKK